MSKIEIPNAEQVAKEVSSSIVRDIIQYLTDFGKFVCFKKDTDDFDLIVSLVRSISEELENEGWMIIITATDVIITSEYL